MQYSYDNTNDAAAPAMRMWLITPHDTNEQNPWPRAIRADTDGTAVLRAIDSDADVTINMKAGEILPIRAQYIRTTSTATLHGLG